MRKGVFFPAVDVRKTNEGNICATAVIRLVSVQGVQLRAEEDRMRAREALFPYRQHCMLLQALAAWPTHVSFSLNLLTAPEPDSPLNGRIRIAILLSVSGGHSEAVVAELLARYAGLFSLLETYLPEAEFATVSSDRCLRKWIAPFHPISVFSIERRRETFVLTADGMGSDNGSSVGPIGFLVPDPPAKGTLAERHRVEYIFPWHQEEYRDLSSLFELFLQHPCPLCFRVSMRPAVMDHGELHDLRVILSGCEDLLARGASGQAVLSLQVKALRSAISEKVWQQGQPMFRGACLLASESLLDESLVAAMAEVISPVCPVHGQEIFPFRGGVAVRPVEVQRFLIPVPGHEIITSTEAACAFRIPWPLEQDAPGITTRTYRTAHASPELVQRKSGRGLLLLGDNRYKRHRHAMRVADEERLRHTCILGQTGTGKSALLESMALQDIRAGKGICFIDPHGDSIEKILHLYPENRADDLVLVDFLDRERIIPFNLLAWKDEEERDHIIEDLYGWIDMTYDLKQTGGPIFEQYFRGFLRALMGDRPRREFTPVLADFLNMFFNVSFRDYCCHSIDDLQVQRMLRQADRAGGESSLNNMAPYVTSKLNIFDLDPNIRRMVGQEKMRLDFRDIMDSGKVMLVNLGRGRLGEVAASLLAGQIVSRFKTAAMKRIDIPVHERRNFFLYVDEFQNLASEQFISMLSEARKFHLGLILANQYAGQLEQRVLRGGDTVLKAVLGNVGTTICFRLGINDASMMADVYYPVFSSQDLVNLPLGNCYVNLKSRCHNPESFSIETRYVEGQDRSGHVRHLRALSNRRYTISVREADAEIVAHNRRIEQLPEKTE